MLMKNIVVAGDYEGQALYFTPRNELYIGNGISGGVRISKDTVARYEIASHETSSKFSTGKAVIGVAAFGDIGAVAGIGGKQTEAYRVALYFRDGKQSLIEVDKKHFNALQSELFGVETYTPASTTAPSSIPESSPAKKPHHIWLSILIFVIGVVICVCIADVIYPDVDGKIKLDPIGAVLVVGVPLLAAIFLPKFFTRKK